MARRPRIQFAGASYHVYNRGNYRRAVFGSAGAADCFERTLEEACAQFKWRLHAYKVMGNHYHLALTTPDPNLSDGMHWLQTTFGTRFNRRRREHGRLFQGRFHSPLVEPGPRLVSLVNYIHLNPVRANLTSMEQLPRDRWDSLGRFMNGPRFPSLACEDWLREIGLGDTPRGWRDYLGFLGHLAADKAAQEEEGFGSMLGAWAIDDPPRAKHGRP